MVAVIGAHQQVVLADVPQKHWEVFVNLAGNVDAVRLEADFPQSLLAEQMGVFFASLEPVGHQGNP